MLTAGEICLVTGFEPQKNALKKLNDAKGKLERYLPYAVGDGSEKVLNIFFAEGMSSTFKPDGKMLKFSSF